jgi:ABC-type multidrug transport system fused ATPase/permease subunit
MKIFSIIKILLDKKLKKYFFFLIPILTLSTFLELLGIASVPIFLILLFDKTKIINIINKYNFNYNNSLSLIENLNHTDFIIFITIAFILVFLIKNLFLIFVIFYENYYAFKIRVYISQLLSKSYLYSTYSSYINTNSSTVIRNLSHEAKVTSQLFYTIAITIRESLLIGSTLIVFFFIYPKITLAAGIIFTISFLIFYNFVKKKITKISHLLLKLRNKFIELIQEAFGSFVTTLILQRENDIYQLLSKLIIKKEKLELQINFIHKLPKIYLEIIFVFLITTLIAIISYNSNDFTEQIGILSLFAAIVIRLIPSFNNLNANIMNFKSQYVSAAHIASELKKVKLKTKIKSSAKFRDFYGDIKFKNVNFKYKNASKYLFKNLNIYIKKNSTILIKGKSGSGKTTFVNLLLGLLKPTSGKILSEGSNINEDEYSWRKILGYVTQDVFLINDTVKKNILIGIKSKINKKSLKKSIKQSNVNEFLYKHINKKIGERGNQLSGGQKQRISIARTLYKNPKIIVFDESTNAIDYENEKKIIKDIKRISKNKIIIFISHKKIPMIKFNKVINIDKLKN